MDIKILLAPLVGACIGYITNLIAIKMLFRPVRPVYIGSWRLPLTPGLIPREKARLAMTIGDVVGGELLSEESVRRALLSEQMLNRISTAANELVARGRDCEDTLGELMARYVSGGEAALGRGKDWISGFLAERLAEADIGRSAARALGKDVKKNALGEMLAALLGEKIRQLLSEQVHVAVNGYLERHSEDIVRAAVDRETEKLLSTRVCDLAARYEDKIPDLTQKLINLYRTIVEQSLHGALSAIDIAGIVRGRIESIDDMELEEMVLRVVDTELKAIVSLGALLGLFMGFVNLLFL